MKKYFFLFILLTTAVFASEIKLKDKLALSTPGSYLVLEQNKTFTLLHIHSQTNERIVLEEVSIPATNFSKDVSWKEWFEKGAPGHTSWVMSLVNLKTGKFEETFSFTHKGWIDLSTSDSFFTTLLNIPFQEVSEKDRRKVGLPPGQHKKDVRPFWNPRLVVEGRQVPHVSFTAYKARWPADGTDLSRKVVEIYLPETSSAEPAFPVCFPYWIEVEGKYSNAKVRVVDSGNRATSTKPAFPKRPPQLIGDVQLNDGGLSLKLRSPSYFEEFMVLAEDPDAFFGSTFPLPCSSVSQNNGIISLFIDKEHLRVLEGELAQFRLIISPKGDPSLMIKSSAITLDKTLL